MSTWFLDSELSTCCNCGNHMYWRDVGFVLWLWLNGSRVSQMPGSSDSFVWPDAGIYWFLAFFCAIWQCHQNEIPSKNTLSSLVYLYWYNNQLINFMDSNLSWKFLANFCYQWNHKIKSPKKFFTYMVFISICIWYICAWFVYIFDVFVFVFDVFVLDIFVL